MAEYARDVLKSEKHYRWQLDVSKLYPALLINEGAALSFYPERGIVL